jgi:hypothetical protein
MDKTRAQGYAEGLSTAFRYVFKEEFNAWIKVSQPLLS